MAFRLASSGTIVSTSAPRARRAADSYAVAAVVAVRSEVSAAPAVGISASTREPRPGGDRVEVRRAPDAAVDVLALADLHRREDPRHRARGEHGLRRPSPWARPARRRSPACRCARSTAAIRSRPSKRAPSASRCLPRSPSVRSGRGARRRTAARASRPAGAVTLKRDRRERRRHGLGGAAQRRQKGRLLPRRRASRARCAPTRARRGRPPRGCGRRRAWRRRSTPRSFRAGTRSAGNRCRSPLRARSGRRAATLRRAFRPRRGRVRPGVRARHEANTARSLSAVPSAPGKRPLHAFRAVGQAGRRALGNACDPSQGAAMLDHWRTDTLYVITYDRNDGGR